MPIKSIPVSRIVYSKCEIFHYLPQKELIFLDQTRSISPSSNDNNTAFFNVQNSHCLKYTERNESYLRAMQSTISSAFQTLFILTFSSDTWPFTFLIQFHAVIHI